MPKPPTGLAWRRLAAALAVQVGFWAAPAAAQSLIRGTVVDSAGRPLSGADVSLEPAGAPAARTGPDGRYSIVVGPGAIVRILARRIGFEPVVKQLFLAPDDTVTVDFRLLAGVQSLEPVTVTASGTPDVAPKMREFEERRRAGIGRFLTREALARREQSVLSDVLRLTAGLALVRRPEECGGGFAVAAGRGGVVAWQRWMRCENSSEAAPVAFPLACYVAVYVDGIRVWFPGQTEPPNIDAIGSVASLEGVEIYRGPSETPIRYQGTNSACGVVLLWTRAGG